MSNRFQIFFINWKCLHNYSFPRLPIFSIGIIQDWFRVLVQYNWFRVLVQYFINLRNCPVFGIVQLISGVVNYTAVDFGCCLSNGIVQIFDFGWWCQSNIILPTIRFRPRPINQLLLEKCHGLFIVLLWTVLLELVLLVKRRNKNSCWVYRELRDPIVEANIISWYCGVPTKLIVARQDAASFRITEPSETRLPGQCQLLNGLVKQLPRLLFKFIHVHHTRDQFIKQLQLIACEIICQDNSY